MIDNIEMTEYNAALSGAAFFHAREIGFLRILGEDRVDFLQRQTTNDLRGIDDSSFVETVVTSPGARILDVLTLFHDGETLIGLTLPDRGAVTRDFFSKRIFYGDRVEVEEFSEDHIVIDIPGWESDDKLGIFPGIEQLNPGRIARTELAGIQVWALKGGVVYGDGLRMILPAEVKSKVVEHLEEQGYIQMSTGVRELMRIEAGLPGYAVELQESYTPLETGLVNLVGSNKGCYTGQEVLARQVNYDKITKKLTGIRLEAPAEVGDSLYIGSKNTGSVTSMVISPRFGPVALAVVRRPFPEIGTEVMVGGVKGRISETPFS